MECIGAQAEEAPDADDSVMEAADAQLEPVQKASCERAEFDKTTSRQGTTAGVSSSTEPSCGLKTRVSALERDTTRMFRLMGSSGAVASTNPQLPSNVDAAIRSARGVDDLRVACEGLLKTAEATDGFYCSVCTKGASGTHQSAADGDFLARVAALIDVYKVLASGSRIQQQVQNLPWQYVAGFGHIICTIREMADILEVPTRGEVSVANMIELADMDTRWPPLSSFSPCDKTVTKDATAFRRSLARQLRHRRGGLNATDSIMGTDNQSLMDAMLDIREVADLEHIRAASDASAGTIQRAASRLVARRVVPPSCRLSLESATAGYKVLHEPRCANGCNQQLFKVLWESRDSTPSLGPYVDLVTRLWLIFPTDSVVESMGSAVQEVFGMHRQLDHVNAAKELVVRWNGPDPCQADDVIRAVQRKAGFNFTRHSTSLR